MERLAFGADVAFSPAEELLDGVTVLAVIEGSGEVSGADGVAQPIGPGEAVFWRGG